MYALKQKACQKLIFYAFQQTTSMHLAKQLAPGTHTEQKDKTFLLVSPLPGRRSLCTMLVCYFVASSILQQCHDNARLNQISHSNAA